MDLSRAPLESVATEELILFAVRAVGAFKAANEQDCDAQRDEDGQHTRVGTDPLEKSMHMPPTAATTSSAPVRPETRKTV